MNDQPDTPAAPPHRRAIRSFVKRGGRATAAQQRAIREQWPRFGVEEAPGALDLPALFGREAPRTLEIGFGDGEQLATLAARHPERDYLGVEVHEPGVGHLLLRVAELGLTNVRVACHDAVELLRDQVPEAALDEVLVYFPDPWHKARHHKRRLIQPPFVELVRTRLRPGGILRLATDWEHYAEQMLAVLSAAPGYRNLAADGAYIPRPPERPVTKFERRGHRLGHGTWDLAFTREA